MKPQRWVVAGAAAAAAMSPATAVAAPSTARPATLTMVDAYANSTVDAYVNGQRIASGLKAGSVSQPTALPAGSVTLTFTKPGTRTALASTRIRLAAGSRTSAAYFPADGQAAVAVFDDAVQAPSQMLLVRQLAQAPAMDITVNGHTELTNLDTNTAQSLKVSGTSARVSAVQAGTQTSLSGEHLVTLSKTNATVLYVWGTGNAIQMTPQYLSAAAIPSKIPAGEGPEPTGQWQGTGLLALAGASVVGGLYFATRYRPRHRR